MPNIQIPDAEKCIHQEQGMFNNLCTYGYSWVGLESSLI